MNDTVAEIKLDPKNRTIKDMKVTQKQFHFKCKRCATLCCKLGGPPLTKNDTELLEKAGHSVEKFLEPTNRETKAQGNLRTNGDGSCIFLQQDTEGKCFRCGIYDFRPALCRLYPFSYENLGNNTIALKLIPCCRGLNNDDAIELDKEFISSSLLDPLLEAMELLPNGKLM